MHAGNSRQLGLEMRDGAQIRFIGIEITESATQESEQFWFVMIAFRANFNQLHKIGGRLRTQIISANPGKGITQRYFGERVQIGFPARGNGDVGLEEQIQFAGKRTFDAASALRHGLDATQ